MKLNLRSETAAAIVAGASFIASAGHIVKVVDETNALALALVYPIGIDGLIYVGIRALQSRRPVAGIAALLIGGFYSLAFNAHAEGALTMSRLLIAASMPICMMVAFVIEATGRKAEEIAPVIETREVVKVERVYPELLPIVAPAKRPAVAARKPRATIIARTDAPKASGRTAAWDVEKAIRLFVDGRTDEDVLAAVDGLTAKPWQRTKRAARMINDGKGIAETAAVCGVSATHVQRIKEAM